MVVGITDRRLLVWAVGRRRQARAFLGAVDRSRITGAVAPTVGRGLRTVVIELGSDERVTIRVPAELADGLAEVLAGQLPIDSTEAAPGGQTWPIS